jgi:fatty acid desaturase
MVWHLYGNTYDFTKYLDNHPGGSIILQNTENQKDITALFENFHSFSSTNKSDFVARLQKYLIKMGEPREPEFDFTNYNKLVDKIRPLFPTRKSIKAPSAWYIQNIFTTILYILSFYYAMFSNMELFYKCILAQISGLCFISIGFNVFHDASHYAVSTIPFVNQLLAKLWASWGLWNSNIWFYHHVVNHHSFTGLEKLDPDLYHLGLFATKTQTYKTPPLLCNKIEYIPLITVLFPGMYIGQSLTYFLSIYKNRLFRYCILPNKIAFYDIIDVVCIFLNLYSLFCGWYLPTMNYILALNFWYFINIAFDHDTYESNIENHYSGTDWLKLQICHSGNFMNNHLWWTRIFGSINYQIEHHLFPNISSYHYPTISPIVREFCKENHIPYTHHSTISSAYSSYLKMLRYRNQSR